MQNVLNKNKLKFLLIYSVSTATKALVAIPH